jgi:multidrug efflux pump subunit AcrA (membrane-fusion protein)
MREGNRRLLERLDGFGDDDLPAGFLDEVELFQRRAAATGVYLSALDDRAEAQSLVNFWLTVRFNGGGRPETIILDEFDTEAARARAGGAAPYKGLDAFQVEDVGSFFGRAATIRAMLDRLGASRMLAVTGLSGSGKSSVVRAGLIPRLREGELPGSREWRVLDPIVPGKDPVQALADLAVGLAPSSGPLREPADLVEALDAVGAPVLLSVDQFEELFTLCGREEDRRFVLDALTAAATGGEHRHVVIITMRSEFDSRVETDPAFAELFAAGRIQIGALSARELRTAIEQPAAQVGVHFEPGLPDELVQRVLGEPAGLPLLQFTLLELWKRRTADNKLGWEAYTALGGSPREILARRATEVYESFETNQDRTFSHRIFLALAEIGAGLEPTGRRVARAELDRIGSRDSVDHVLGVWQENGLIRISPPGPIARASQVEVAHEALIRNWDLLVGWIEDHFAQTRRRRVLTEQALAWKEGHDTLLGELSVKEAEGLADLDDIERDYVAASRREVDRQYRSMRRRNWAGASVAAASLLLLVFALTQYNRAQDQKLLAQHQKQLAQDQGKVAHAQQMQAEQAADELRKFRRSSEAQLDRARAELRSVEITRNRAQAAYALAQARVALAVSLGRRMSADMAAELAKARAEAESAAREVDEKVAALAATDAKIKEANARMARLVVAQERPAIELVDGRLGGLGKVDVDLDAATDPVPGEVPWAWRGLHKRAAAIEAAARSVGRLQGGMTDPGTFGTAFVVADGVVMATRSELPQNGDASGMNIDFRPRPDGDQRHEFRIEAVIGVLSVPTPKHGIVLLRVAKRNGLGESLPPPLPIVQLTRAAEIELFALPGTPEALEPRRGMNLYLLGYPIPDFRQPAEISRAVLGDAMGVKRVQPGVLQDYRMSGVVGILKYDMTPFNGDEGAPVIDLETGLVVGIHTGVEISRRKIGIAFFKPLTMMQAWREAGLRTVPVPPPAQPQGR